MFRTVRAPQPWATLCAVVIAGLLSAAPAAAATVTLYTQTFDSALGSEWSGITNIESVQGYQGEIGFNAQMLRNATGGPTQTFTTLTLTGLQVHTAVSIDFLLAIIDSWDGSLIPGSAPGCCHPDFLHVRVDGVDVFNESFDNFQGGFDQSYVPPPATTTTPLRSNQGFNTAFDPQGVGGGFLDAGYRIDPGWIAHTSSTITIDWFADGAGWQGGGDESWGMDELKILLDVPDPAPVPEPATLSLLGLGLLGVARRVTKRTQR